MRLRIPDVQFRAPDGSLLPATHLRADIRFAPASLGALAFDGLDGIQLQFELTLDDWQRVDSAEWFHNPRSQQSPLLGGPFKTGPIRVEAALEPAIRSAMAMDSPDSPWETAT